MATTRVSRKGQVIIPKQIREARRWTPGTQLEVRETAEGVLLTQLAAAAKRPVRQGVVAIRERVGYRGTTKSIEEMDAAVLREAAQRQARR